MTVTVPFTESKERTTLGEALGPFRAPKEVGKGHQAVATVKSGSLRSLVVFVESFKNPGEVERITLWEDESEQRAGNAGLAWLEPTRSKDTKEDLRGGGAVLEQREWEACQVLLGFPDAAVVHEKPARMKPRAGPSNMGSTPQETAAVERVLRPRDKKPGPPPKAAVSVTKPRKMKPLPKRAKEETMVVRGTVPILKEAKSEVTQSGRPKRKVGGSKKLKA